MQFLRRTTILALALLCFSCQSPLARQGMLQAQEAAPPDIEFNLPEGADEFGNDDFEFDTSMTEEQAAAGAFFAAVMSAFCTGVPALLLGIIIGYFIGKNRGSKGTSVS